jgi:AraC family transcriptional regulator, alkane utilization regulator
MAACRSARLSGTLRELLETLTREVARTAEMDVLSDLLAAIRLTGGVFLRADLRAPFAVRTLSGVKTCAAFGQRCERVVPYHLVVQGTCWARVDGEPDIELQRGDLLLLPRGERHVLTSRLDMKAIGVGDVLPAASRGAPILVRLGGEGALTQLVCGYLACQGSAWNPLLEALPRMFSVSVREGPAAAWISSCLDFALKQTHEKGPALGAASQLARLSELLFVEALRRYIADLPETSLGWLAALRDRYVGKAIAAFHAAPDRAWTVEAIADEVGLSRATFAARFTDLVGMTPMDYLTRWRMQTAARLLTGTERTVTSVALDAGYRSEAAFIRAFRREFGKTPALWRRERARQRPVSSRKE